MRLQYCRHLEMTKQIQYGIPISCNGHFNLLISFKLYITFKYAHFTDSFLLCAKNFILIHIYMRAEITIEFHGDKKRDNFHSLYSVIDELSTVIHNWPLSLYLYSYSKWTQNEANSQRNRFFRFSNHYQIF